MCTSRDFTILSPPLPNMTRVYEKQMFRVENKRNALVTIRYVCNANNYIFLELTPLCARSRNEWPFSRIHFYEANTFSKRALLFSTTNVSYTYQNYAFVYLFAGTRSRVNYYRSTKSNDYFKSLRWLDVRNKRSTRQKANFRRRRRKTACKTGLDVMSRK